jgi:hypothetical protein
MKNIIKTLLLSATFLTLTISTLTVQAAEEKLNSAMGHPYKLLINRASKVKIIYSEGEKNINCKVVVNWHEQEIKSQSIRVSRESFNEKPLASCLPRNKAKSMLAATFQ